MGIGQFLQNMKKLRIEPLLSLMYASLIRQKFFESLKVNESIALIYYKNTLNVLISRSIEQEFRIEKNQK